MKIVFQFNEILPVLKYGGIERIVFWHMQELVKKGHEVILIGNPKSNVSSHGIKHILYDHNSKIDWRTLVPKDADIIHLSYNYDPEMNIPCVNTVHGNGKINEIFNNNAIFISKKHAENHNAEMFIYNGINLDEYKFNSNKKFKWDNFLFLAKGSWSVKNLKDCKRACKKNKKTLHIAGGRNYLPSRFIKSYGIVGAEEKINIISKCDALLWPVRWHEPFGIAVIEAMALGLPVISSPFGSLPELIGNGVAGKVVDNYEQFEKTIRENKLSFNPKEIRSHVENNFSISKHTDEYITAYERVISGESLNSKNCSWKHSKEAVELLPF